MSRKRSRYAGATAVASGASAIAMRPPVSLWILDSWRDLLLFVATPALILPLFFTARLRWTAEEIALFVASFGALGHHLPGMLRAYGDRALFERFKVRFIVSPIFLVFTCTLFGALDLSGIVLVVYFWGVWHALMQTYGFLRIYDSKKASFASLTCRLDLLMCIGWFGCGVIWSPTRLSDILDNFYKSGGNFIPGSLLEAFRVAWSWGTAGITILFLAHAVWAWRRKAPPSAVKLILMATSFSFYWYANVAVENMLLSVALFEVFHDVQYLSIVWVYSRNRVKKDPAVGSFTRFLFQQRGSLIGLYIGLVFSYGALNLIPYEISKETLRNAFTGLLASSALLHFYYDGFIWKVRERSTRQSLGLKGSGAMTTPKTKSSIWKSHGLKWCALIIPVAWLGFSEIQSSLPKLERLDAVVQSLPDSAPAHYDLAVALGAAGRMPEAARHYKRTLELRPSYPEAHLNLGVILGSRGRPDQAIRHFNEAVRLRPDYAEAHNDLAVTLHSQGKIDEAIPHYLKALDIHPENAQTHFNLGAAFEMKGKLREAATQYSQALEISPDLTAARDRLKRLEMRTATPPE